MDMLISSLINSKIKRQLYISDPTLVAQIGYDEATILQRIFYWRCVMSNKKNDKACRTKYGKVWIYNTFNQWHEQFPQWSLSKIKRIFSKLEKEGYILSAKLSVHKCIHTKWYTINDEKVIELLNQIEQEWEDVQVDKSKLSLAQKEPFYNTEINISKSYLSRGHILKTESLERKELEFLNEKEELSSRYKEIYNKKQNNDQYIITQSKKEITPIISISNEYENVFTQMIDEWNGIFLNHRLNIVLTHKRKEKLLHLWKNMMDEKIEKWQKFCLMVNKSAFLMGEKKEGFRGYFDWIISEEITCRILAGEFGVGDRIPDIEKLEKTKSKKELYDQYKQKELDQKRVKEEQEQKIKITKIAEKLQQSTVEQLYQGLQDCERQKVDKKFEEHIGQEHSNAWLTYKREGRESYWIEILFVNFVAKEYLNTSLDDFYKKVKENILHHKVMSSELLNAS